MSFTTIFKFLRKSVSSIFLYSLLFCIICQIEAMEKTFHLIKESSARPQKVKIHENVEIVVTNESIKNDSRITAMFRGLRVKGTALQQAIANCSIKEAVLFIKNGADVTIYDSIGLTPLQYALNIRYGCYHYRNNQLPHVKELDELIAYLIVSGACVNDTDDLGATLLYHAAESAREDLIQLLLARQSLVNVKNMFGDTPLHKAAQSENLETVSLLIKHGADVNATNGIGWTVLHSVIEKAASGGNLKVILLLLKHGAFLSWGECARFFDRAADQLLDQALKQGNLEVTSLAVNLGANVIDALSNTALQRALKSDSIKYNLEVIPHLVSLGADINAKNKFGKSALHFAVEQCSVELTTLLMSLGSDANAQDKSGKTPLHSAALYPGKKEMAKMVMLLISFGADVHARDYKFYTPISDIDLNREYFSEEEYSLITNPEKNVLQILKNVAHYLEPYEKNSKNKGLDVLLRCIAVEPFVAKIHKKMSLLFEKVSMATLINDQMMLAEFTIRRLPLSIWNTIKNRFLAKGTHQLITLEEAFLKQALVNVLKKAVNYNQIQSINEDFKRRIKQLLALHIKRGSTFSAGRWARTDFCSPKNLSNQELNQTLLARTPEPASKRHERNSQQPNEGAERLTNERIDVFRSGLAIDAEGMQIVAAASAVRKLEEEAGDRAYKLFDCIVGSSWGGILALALAASEDGHKPLLKIDKIISFFKEKADELFPSTMKKSGASYYDIKSLKEAMKLLFKNARLSCSLTRVVVSFRENIGTIQVKKGIFDSVKAQKNENDDFELANIACAIIADGVNLWPVTWEENGCRFNLTGRDYTLNADMLLYEQNKNRFENHSYLHEGDNLVILSITTVQNGESETQTNSHAKLKSMLTGRSIYERISLNVQEATVHGAAIFDAYEKEGIKFFAGSDQKEDSRIVKQKNSFSIIQPRYKKLIEELGSFLKQ